MQRRQRQRLVADLQTTCRNPAIAHLVWVSNISKSGCSVKSSDLHLSERVILDLPEVGHIPGLVMWAEHGQCGIQFTREIDDWEIATVGARTSEAIRAQIRRIPSQPQGNQPV